MDWLRLRKLARGIVDRIGASAAYSFKADNGAAEEKTLAVANHEIAVRLVIDWLRSRPELGAVDAVGHRVVHGGDRFVKSVLIDDDVIAAIEDLCEIAPLHNPGAVSGIRAARKILGAAVPMVAAFDTSFHHTIPEPAALYAIPYELSLKHKIRRYGFHGLAHQYDISRYAELSGKPGTQVSAVTLASRQWLLGDGDSQRPIDRYVNGLYAARRLGDGHALGRSRSGAGELFGAEGEGGCRDS